MSKPQRIQRKRTKGWRMPENAIYVGRPTIWGNPYTFHERKTPEHEFHWRIDSPFMDHLLGLHETRQEAAAHCVELFIINIADRLDNLDRLRGMDLACWCPLDQPCHADVLLEIANKEHE